MRNINVLFDMSLERPTLGGAIILRKESELIAKAMGIFKINLIIKNYKYKKKNFEKYFKEVFSRSKYNFKISYNFKRKKIYWPTIQQNSNVKLSYITFSRINKLVKKFKVKPILEWNKKTLFMTKRIRKKLPKRLIAVHLKNISPFKKKESNANGKIWNKFFKNSLRDNKLNFLLIGNDKIPNQIRLRKNIFLAKKIKIPLGIQLCLVSMCDGFLGMASGPSVAANFTNIPYYIFKHPSHDKEEMKREIGNAKRLRFAKKNQILLRKMPSTTILEKITYDYYGRI